MSDKLEPVTGAPSPDEALSLLDTSAAAESASAAVSTGAVLSAEPKRKGGWPKGKPRPKKDKATAAPAGGKVYDGTTAAGQGPPPIGAEQIGAPRRFADPALIEQCKPALISFVKAATALLARITGKPGMKATAEECELLAETGAPLLVMRMPAVAESSPEMAFGAAMINYALPRLGEFSAGDGVPQAAPVVDVPAPAPAVSVAVVTTAPAAPSYPGLAQTGTP